MGSVLAVRYELIKTTGGTELSFEVPSILKCRLYMLQKCYLNLSHVKSAGMDRARVALPVQAGKVLTSYKLLPLCFSFVTSLNVLEMPITWPLGKGDSSQSVPRNLVSSVLNMDVEHLARAQAKRAPISTLLRRRLGWLAHLRSAPLAACIAVLGDNKMECASYLWLAHVDLKRVHWF